MATLGQGKGEVFCEQKIQLTPEGGYAIKLTNRTGGNSVKGMPVSASLSYDHAFTTQVNEFDTIGFVYESGVANGSECYIVTNGIADVLYKDGVAATRGNILIADATDGRCSDITNPGSGLPATETHFKECGHVLENKNSGTNVLVRCAIHFN